MKMATKWKILIESFGVDYFYLGDLIVCNCPIHHGDNQSAFNLNVNENSEYFGRWFCNTRKCHEEFGGDMFGLAKAILSKDKDVSFREVIDFCEDFVKDVKVDFSVSETDNVINFFSKSEKNTKNTVTREVVRSKLIIPAEYYIGRGFSPNILNEFDVGLCVREDAPMYNRVVFPVYSEDGKYLIGCTGRRIDDGPNKWINSKGFKKSCYLYGYHKAIKRAREVGSLILVEGQGDVLRMHEAGIINTVGIFGSSLSDSQEFLLQKTGVMNIVLAMDNDEAGQEAFIKIKERLSTFFNVYKLQIESKDIGDMLVSEVIKLKTQIGNFI